MKSAAALLFLVPACCLAQAKENPAARSLVFIHAPVIDATGSPPRPEMTVVTADGRIAAIGDRQNVPNPRGAAEAAANRR